MSELIIEGAVAGHMNHIYDNGQMTFGELKELLRAAAEGELEGTEKTDGQNIFLSFDVQRQKALAVRNKGHIKYGGVTPEELDSFFKDHPNQALRASFVEASIAFEEKVKNFKPNISLAVLSPSADCLPMDLRSSDCVGFLPSFFLSLL